MGKKHADPKLRLTIAFTAAALLGAGCQELMMGYAEPEWTSVVNHPDGRCFVTDGRVAMDVTFAEPKELPTATAPSWFDSALRSHSVAERQELFSSLDVRASQDDPNDVIHAGEETFPLRRGMRAIAAGRLLEDL